MFVCVRVYVYVYVRVCACVRVCTSVVVSEECRVLRFPLLSLGVSEVFQRICLNTAAASKVGSFRSHEVR